jgi:hypothetical protein
MERGGNKQVVSLQEKMCSCEKWQCYGFPCSHVMAVCAFNNIDSDELISDYYRLHVYARCYEKEFAPIPHEQYWPRPRVRVSLKPNNGLKRGVGRPVSSRIHTEMDEADLPREPPTRCRCSVCNEEGHNCRRCPRRNQS